VKEIKIKNAHMHNLKNIDVTIPKDKLIVVTGVSGSGKSSLVFDLIFEEGRKQYLQSLGMSLEFDDNKFDSITGLSPTIAVKQSLVRQTNSRSTVGSKTGILNMLALLFSNDGKMVNEETNFIIEDDEKLDSSYFSYTSPNGMCRKCGGRGKYFNVNLDKIIPNNEITMQQVFQSIGATSGYMNLLQRKYHEYFYTPFNQLPYDLKDELIYGIPTNNSNNVSYCIERVLHNRYLRGESLKGIYEMETCESCHGFRVGEEARSVFLNHRHIGEIGNMTLSQVRNYLQELLSQNTLTEFGFKMTNTILKKINELIIVRLGHLTLYREMPSLSGGELQRIFLNSHLDSRMDSLIYIFDEPTSGLHEFEKQEILQAILKLKKSGNTVIIVEHDKSTIKLAEHIIDVGPKAGVYGGDIVYQGSFEGLLNAKHSITGKYLSGRTPFPVRQRKNLPKTNMKHITIHNAKTNNLKDLTVSIPLNQMVGIAGVSGSGKSSLISKTLLPLLKNNFYKNTQRKQFEDDYDETPPLLRPIVNQIDGMEHIQDYVEISQAPIGRKMNSTPISYLGLWDKIRTLFSEQPKAMQNNLSAGHFSFNSKGACPVCKGSGLETISIGNDIHFDKSCHECNGKRFNHDTLSIKFKDKDIYDVLEMSITEALTFFEDTKISFKPLKVLEQIGMGYIKLGQPIPTLSGGEAQRIKLAKEIGKQKKGNILYILDEPSTGLSQYDTAKLITLLDELIIDGNSVIVIEHDLDILSSCDWIIELGKGGGIEGGNILAEGTPEQLKENKDSLTGRYL